MSRFTEQLDRFFYDPQEALPPGLDLPEPQATVSAQRVVPDERLCFRLENEWYALPVSLVREVGRVPPLTEVPRASLHLLGVMNLRGEVLPVYSLKQRLRLATTLEQIAGPRADRSNLPRSARVIVLRSPKGDAGILVDAVQDVVRLLPSEIEPAPKGTAERDGIVGLARRNEKLWILLDPEQALG